MNDGNNLAHGKVAVLQDGEDFPQFFPQASMNNQLPLVQPAVEGIIGDRKETQDIDDR